MSQGRGLSLRFKIKTNFLFFSSSFSFSPCDPSTFTHYYLKCYINLPLICMLLTPYTPSIQSLLVLAWSTLRSSPSRIKDMLIGFSHRPYNSPLETSLQRSATYEHELKDLEVHNLSSVTSPHITDPLLTTSKGKAPRRSQQLSGVRRYHP